MSKPGAWPTAIQNARRLMAGAILAAAQMASGPAAADPVALVRIARDQAARCDIAGALRTGEHALAEAKQVWAPDAPGRLVIEQDLATWFNRHFAARDAEAHARAALAIAGKRSPAEQAVIGQNLAVALASQGRISEAGPFFAQSTMALAGGQDASSLVNAELAYGGFEINAGRATSGLAHLERAGELARGAAIPAGLHADVALQLADAYRRALKLDAADAALDEAERARAGAGLPASQRLALVRVGILAERGRIAAALSRIQALEQAGIQADACDPTLAVDVAHRRGTLLLIRRELPEASAAFTTALGLLAPLRLTGNPRDAEISYGLAVVAAMSRDAERASTLFDRTADAFRRVYAGPSEAEAQTYIEKSRMLSDAGRGAESVAAARHALAILDGGIEQTPLARAYAHAALGLALAASGDRPAASTELRLALQVFEKARGAASFDLVPGIQALGEIALAEGRSREAEAYLRRAVSLEQRWGGASALALGTTLSSLAAAQEKGGAHQAALATSAQAVAVLQRRLAIGETRPWNDAELERRAAGTIVARDLELVAATLTPRQAVADPALAERVFTSSQIANATTTGSAIAQVASRLQTDPALAALLGERNDLAAEWRSIQDELIQSLTASTEDDARRESLLVRQGVVGARIGAIDGQLTARDPKLDLLLKSRIVEIATLQTSLRPNEAALILSVGESDSYGIVVTRKRALVFRGGVGRAAVAALVSRVRATLDPLRWKTELPAFDLDAAQQLSQAFVQPFLPLMDGIDTLLVVPDGALGSLPFSVLPTAASPPLTGDPSDYAKVPWLLRRMAVVSYPSAASIVALRQAERTAAPHSAMLGVGAPVLDGALGLHSADDAILRGMAGAPLADVSLIRTLPPLPDTRKELDEMAKALGSDSARLLLGAQATEANVRKLPLDGFGVIVFATHGLVAGELAGFGEPGLVLTPPAKPSPADDGLLTASEVALMKMRAEWVILSACNTAAGDGSPRAEPLSGLAKSFFYAGARSLLVTHWSVDSEAAAKLTVATVKARADGKSAAMALRAAELEFVEDRDGSLRTHPFFWAPFQMIGG